jgi:uncharacterized repeat protein (TIGR01451 family)
MDRPMVFPTPDFAMFSVPRTRRTAALYAFAAVPSLSAVLLAAPVVEVTKDDGVPTGTRKLKGEEVTYTNTIRNTGDAAASAVQFVDNDVAGTTVVAGSLTATPVALDDAYSPTVIANMSSDSSASGFSVLSNDFFGYSGGNALALADISITAFDATSANGGTVAMTTSGAGKGQFVYTPAAGYTGPDTFTYTISNGVSGGTAISKVGTVSLTVSGPVIWFVSTTGSDITGKGTVSQPFLTVGKAATTALTSQSIFVYSGSYSSTVATLKASQSLVGQGIVTANSFDQQFGITPGVGTPVRPSLNGTAPTFSNSSANHVITLANANTLRGFSITGATGSGKGIIGASSINTGTVGSDVSVAGCAGGAFSLGSGTGAFTMSAPITNSSGNSVVVSGRTGGTVTFNAAISDTGAGISLATNTGATIQFSGGLNIALTTASATAFSATGGGTVTVTDNLPTIVNTLSSTSGTGLNVTNTTIGASGLFFRSISAGNVGNSAGNGITLDNTGNTAGLTVRGNGSAGTGGTIQHKTGANAVTTAGIGIYLNSTRDPSFDRMQLNDFDNFAILGTSVTNFTMTNSVVSGTNGNTAAQAITEGGVVFHGLTGTATITSVQVSGALEDNFRIYNSSGSLTVNFTGLTIGANSLANGNDGLHLQTLSTATMTASVQNSFFTSSRGDLVQAANNGTGALSLTFNGNTLSNNHGGIATGGGGVTLNGGTTATDTFTITNNTFKDAVSHGVLIVKQQGASILNGSFTGNTIGVSGTANSGSREGSGIKLQTVGGGKLSFDVTGNTIYQYNNNGIEALAGGGASAQSGILALRVTGNTVANPGNNAGTLSLPKNGFHLNLGTVPGDTFDAYLTLGGTGGFANTLSAAGIDGVPATGAGDNDVRLRHRQSTTVHLYGKTGASTVTGYSGGIYDTSAVQTFVTTHNPSTVVLANTSSSGGGYVGTPSTPVTLLLDPALPAEAEEEVAIAASETAAVVKAVEQTSTIRANVPTTVVPEPALMADSPASLTQGELDLWVLKARTIWEASGLTSEQSDVLKGLRFEVTDLPNPRLGEADGRTIRVNRQAGGHRWGMDHDFDASQPDEGSIDLLTTVLHEMGHALGLHDSYDPRDRSNLMYGYLGRGERRLPMPGQAIAAVPHDDGVAHFLTAPLNPIALGNLPAGKEVVIVYKVTINNDITAGSISSQASVSGGNFTTVLSDDTALPGGAQDPTVTLIGIPPAFTNADSATFQAGVAGTTFNFAATGQPAPTFSTLSTLPSGMTLASNGLLSGTPAAGTGGVHNLVVTASNGIAPAANQNFTLTVNEAPVFTSANSTTFTTESAGTFTVTTSSFPANAALSLTSGSLPSGVTFTDNGNGTATLAGTPAAAAGGTYSLTFSATNGITPNGSQIFTLTVNQAPVITSANVVSFTEGVANSFTVTTTGFPTGASMDLSSSGSLPSGVTFTDNGDGTATLAGTAAFGSANSYPLTFTANNGVAPNATQNFTLTVKPPVHHFTVSAPASATAGTPVNVTVTAFDSSNVVVTGYTGTVHFTSTDLAADLPTDYTFTAGDNGVHVFSVTLKTAASQTVSVADTVVVPTAAGTSDAISVSAGAANKLAFLQQPTNAVSQAAISPAVTVRVLDAFDNLTTSTADVTVAIGTNPGSGTLSGTATVAAVSGVATFPNLSIDKAGTGYTLDASSTDLTGATSSTFNITAGAANQLAFLQQPSNAVAGVAISPAVTVRVLDAAGNLTTSTADVTVAIGTNPGSGTLSGTATVAAVSGVATFSNLSINKAGTGYTLGASSTDLTGATSSTFDITAAAAAKLALLQQPSNAVAGVAISPAVTVRILDAFDNLTSSTADVTVAIGTNPSSGTLSGTATVAAVSGVATFSTLSIDKAGTGYTLAASSSGLTGTTSSTFDITAAAAAKLAFLQQPSNTVAGVAISPAVTVRVLDAFDNLTSSTADVTVAIGTNPSSGTLSGTATVAAVSGVATFSNLSIDKAGTGYTLSASGTDLTGATSSAFDITAAAAAKLAFSQQPSNTVAGVAISPAVTVRILDAFDNLTSSTADVTVAIGTNPNSGTLSGTATVAAVSGVATFSDLSIDKAGTGYTLNASGTDLTGTTSSTFDITAAAAAKLAFLQQPTNAISQAAISPAVTVRLLDAFDNLTTSTADVTVAIGTNPNSGTLSGTATVAAVSGVATFSNLSIDKAGTGYTLGASSTDLTGATSSTFNITAGAANQLAFLQQPSNAVAGVAISPAVTVRVLDAAGNLTTSTADVTVAIGTNPGSGTLSGTATVAAVSGVATFSDLSINKAGTGYTLGASSTDLTGATSSSFDITAAAGAKLAFSQQPSNAVAGVAISPAVTVRILDAFDNLTTSTAEVIVAIDTNPNGGTLSGTASANAVSGVATFSNLSIDKAGIGYTLDASSPSDLTGTTSSSFDITAAAPAKLAFLQQPSNTVAGVAISPAMTVRILDVFDNLTSSTADVTVAIGTNPGSGTLSGTATVAAVSGVATFSSVSINKVGIGYTLDASSTDLTGATSSAFDITPAAATHFAVSAPANATAGTSFNFTVTALDAFDNTATGYSGLVHFTSSDAPATLPADSTLTSGVGTFAATLKTAGNQTLTGTDTVTASITGTSESVSVVAGEANKLAFSASPSNAVAGTSIGNVVVQIQDVFGNLTTSTADVTVAIGTNPGSGTLSGTATVAAASGVATFSNVSINKVGTGYTLDASSGGLTGATSSAFNITPAAASHFAVAAPANAVAGTSFNFTVTALDAFDNTATGYSGTVHFTSSDAPATLPADSTLTSGAGTFAATLMTGGNQTLTATDTVTASITGTSASILVDPRSDLAVTLSDSPDPVTAGTNLTYTIQVSNNGPSAAANVSLSDTLPAGTTFVSLSSPGGWSASTPAVGASGSVILTKATVAPAETGTFTLVVNVAASVVNGTVISDTVTASTTTSELTPANNSATATTTVSTSADLAMVMTDTPDPANAGTNITYTLTLTNNGPSDAVNPSISDVLPAGTTYVSSIPQSGWSTTAPAVGANGTVIFSAGVLSAGGSAQFTIVVKADASIAAGTVVSNTSTASASTSDPNAGNNSANTTTTISRSADLAIVMTDSPDPVNATQNVTYTIDVVQSGPSDASSVSVSDTLPPNTTFVSATAPAGWSATTPAVGGTGTITFTKAAMSTGDSAQFTIVANVDLLAPNDSTLTNTAVVSAVETDPSIGNNTATTTTLVKSGADLVVSGSASASVVAGTNLTYSFTVENHGPLDADNALVSLPLPVGTTFVSASSSAGWSGVTPAVGANGTVAFGKAIFANGDSATFTVVVQVSSSVANNTVLTATITAASDTLDLFPVNSSATIQSTVTTEADLAVTLGATPDPVIATADVTYTIGVSNQGPSDATNVSVSLPLPPTMTFVSASGSGWTATTPAVGSGGTVTFTKTALANGASTDLTVVAKVVAGTSNGTVITATTTIGGDDTDPSLGNNVASASVSVGTVNPTPIQIGTTATLKPQIGLYELSVDITNTTPLPINGFRLHVDFSAYTAAFPSLRLYNASSPANSSDVYVDYPYPVMVDGTVTVKLLFYTSTRTFPSPFSPVLTVEKLDSSQVPDTNGNGVHPTIKMLPNGKVLLEFPSVGGHWYRVRYSPDMVNWFDSPVPIQAGGSKTQWIDDGAPFTNAPPASVNSRFYVVNEIDTP